MHKPDKKNVLFICTENAVRSQMAEALLRHKAGRLFNVFSAGTHPTLVDPLALNALSNFGVDGSHLASKNIAVFDNEVFDYVITLCDKANDVCRSYATAGKQLTWDLRDQKVRSDSNAYALTLNELDSRLSMFLLVERNGINRVSNSQTNSIAQIIDNQLTDFEPIAFYKSLTDTIRLKTLMLTHYHGELCVCELMEAMAEDSQPKVSRNLAVLKKANVIVDRKHGQWVFYRLNPELPLWAKSVIAQTTENNIPLIKDELKRLDNMQNRPDKASFCK